MPILNKRANKTPLGLYVHVPFCRSKCQYCDFYSMATKDDKLMDGYLDAVSRKPVSWRPATRWTPSTLAAAPPPSSVPTVWP